MEYSVVIRTLGKGGEVYQRTLDSLLKQTIPPSAILVYIAEGYPIPEETIGKERYVYVRKGMLAQRALRYDEVDTEYILFLDDDVYLPSDGVEKLYTELIDERAQVISPCVFPNHKKSWKHKLLLSLTGREVCWLFKSKWAFKVLGTAGFSYNNNPKLPVYESQSNAGPCFFCKKEDFLKIHLEDELWVDQTFYAYPEDQVMYYKMYRHGLKLLTSYDSGIIHMDASSTIASSEKTEKLIYSEYRNKVIFWHRFLFMPEKKRLVRLKFCILFMYALGIQYIKYIVKYLCGNKVLSLAFMNGLKAGIFYVKSIEYKRLPKIR